MSRALKKKLKEVVAALEKADKLLGKVVGVYDAETVMKVLTECQNAAITIGEKIEKVYGEGTESVSELEEYCEGIYQIAQASETPDEARIQYEKNRQVLDSFKAVFASEIPEKLEVIFLPYKAAMWDSMKSVWKAASKDEECDAYVMPIPYFDRNPDRSLGEMHDESGTFQMDILDWQTCSLADRMPDVVVIHNPYDEYNIVTTIHPAFYVKELKQYVGKVVYIPYFVHQKDRVKEHYCILPGTVYTDLVVLQSEKVRKQYIQILSEEIGMKKELERRFVALGSPKFDIEEEEEIPVEWEEFLYKKDGKKKKVIFFNTHIVCLMGQADDLFFEKMERIFSVFKKREDVVLLWRPHPLMRATAKSMNPNVLERYEKLVEQYKSEKIGIYDETPDYHIALQIADAYYGNGSSLVEVFHTAGKPVMIMNLRV